MALLSMRADKFLKKTGNKISIQGSDVAGFDKLKVECFNCYKMGHFARECRVPKSQDRGRRDNYRQGSKAEEQAQKALMAIDGVGWDWSYVVNEEEDHALVADKIIPIEFALMADTSAESKVFDKSLCSKNCKKNNDSLNSKITDLTDKLFDANNYIYHYKLALAQVESRLVEYKEKEVKNIEKIRTLKFYNVSNKECIETLKKKLETLNQEKERVDGKLAGLLIALKDLDNLIKSQRPSPTVESTSEDDQNRKPSVSETVALPITPKPFIKFVKPKDSQSESKIDKKETPKKPPVKYAEQYRKPNKKPNKRVRKSFTPKPVAHRPYRHSQRPVRTNMNDARPNKTFFNKQAHSYANRYVHRTSAVRSPYRAPWVPTVNRNYPPVKRNFSTGSRNVSTVNRKFPTVSRKFPTGSTKSSTADMGRKGKAGSSQNKIDDKGYWDNGCSRHMTGNISYLSDYKPFNGGYVSFGQGGCKITGKMTIKTGKMEFENVYFVKDLKYNLFSVLQICNNKSSILFTDLECIVLGRDFKLLDDANILLRTPRQHNMYSIDLNNIVPHRDLTCLVAKASADEWKQHKASCKSKLVNSITKPLHTLHMDLFGPTSDETSGIFKKFITEIENLKDLKVKIIRSDNGGEFRNKEINDFCSQKGIKREFSNARTPQQNGVAERRNRTLIEAARTMLADAKLPVTFWAEAVNTACYVQFLLTFQNQDHCSTEVPEDSENPNPTASTSNPPADQMETLTVETSIPTVNLTAYSTDTQEPSSDARLISKRVANQEETPSLDNILSLTNRFEDILGGTTNSDELNGEEADISNMEIAITASPTPTLRIHKDHPKIQIIGPIDTPIQTRNKSKEEEGIDYDEVFTLVARVEAIRLFLAYASFMGFIVYQMDVKSAFLYGTIDEEVFVMQPPRFQDPEFPTKVYKVEKAMYGLHLAPRAWYQVTPKECHLHEVKRIFRYLKGHPKLGLWYPKESPFDLVAYSDSDYDDLLTKPFDAGRFQYLVVEHAMRCFVKGILNIYTSFMGEHNIDFHPMVDFIEASPLRYALTVKPTVYVSHIRQFWSTTRIETTEEGTKILATVYGIIRTVSESSLRIVPLFDTILVQQGKGSGTPTEPHHTPSPEAPSPSHNTHTSPSLPPVTTTSIPTVTPTETTPIRQYTRRARIAQSFALPTVADEPASPQRDVSQGEACPTDSGFIADQDRATISKSSTLPYDSAPRVTSPAAVEGSMQQTIPELTALCTSLQRQLSELTEKFQAHEVEINRLKAREAKERVSDDTEEMETVLTSMDAATVLASGVVNVSTGSGSIPTASIIAEGSVPTSSEEKVQEQIDAQVARELEEQLEREDQRRAEQIARDAEVVRIHVEEELQSMIDGLDSNNETIAKYLQEYHQFSLELPIERRVELISDLVKYQDNYTKIYKFQSQQRKPWNKKQKRDYYMDVIKNNLGWKVKDFRGMTFEEVEAKFNSVWKQMEDFIPMGSKEEAEKIKRKCLNLEQESAKKQKISGEVPEEAMSPEKVTKEKVKEMMQLVRIEEVYAEALQVKHHIIDWKHLDREDLNQLWRLVKETLSNRPPTNEKEMELWVELNRMYEPDKEDQLWTHTQNFIHAPVDWKLYDSCGVHHVTSKDKEIFMLVEKEYPLRKGLALVMICYKLQTIVATSTTEAEYVAAASCCGQVLWIQNQLLDYGEISVLSCKYWNGESLNMSDFVFVYSYCQCKLFPLLGKLSTVSVFLGFGLTFAGTSKYWGVLRMLMISLRLIPL
nr:hypothetical protein [Tanacetum cinerariifolium]